ncbi:uncharacterized protein [Argopecten irradians]|uniref:uncharacterized protein n=1 Tax=Argopecten irradians TaxID=31199 RepID=UPI003721F25C
MNFRIVCSGADDIRNGFALKLAKLLTSREPKPAFSGILPVQGISDIPHACTFLESDFGGTTIFILDSTLISLTQHRKAFKFFRKITEFLSSRYGSFPILINKDVPPEDLEEFKQDFDLPENFEQVLVQCADRELEDIANHAYRLIAHATKCEENTSVPANEGWPCRALESDKWGRMSTTSLQESSVCPLPSYYLRQPSLPDSSSSNEDLNNYQRRATEHHCSMSSTDSVNGTRMSPIGNSMTAPFKGQVRSVPMPRSPKIQQEPEFKSEPAGSHLMGYNLDHVTLSNNGSRRVPEQNQENSFSSEEMFISNHPQQQLIHHAAMNTSLNDNGSLGRGPGGLQFLSEEPLSQQSDIVSSYVLGDMNHLLDDLGENELSESMFNPQSQGHSLPPRLSVNCNKPNDVLAVENNENFIDEPVVSFPTFGPTAMSRVCADCVERRKSDSIPSIESNEVNSMIMSDASGKLDRSGNSFGSHQHQKFGLGQQSQQRQRSLAAQRFPQQSEGLDISERSQDGQGLKQRHVLLNERVNQTQEQSSQEQSALNIQMNLIATGMAKIRVPGNQMWQQESRMPSIQKIPPKGGTHNRNMAGMQNIATGLNVVPNSTRRITSSPQKMTSSPQRMASPPQRMASPPQRMTSPPQRMTSLALRMASPPQRLTSQRQFITSTVSLPNLQQETEINLLSNDDGASRGLRSLPDNIQSHTAGYLEPNIRHGSGATDHHSTMQSYTGNRFGDYPSIEHTDPHQRENRSTIGRGNSNTRRGCEDGASGGTDPTNDVMAAENQVDIHELAFPIVEYIRNQLDCSQMNNWKNLADLHHLNYRQIQEIEQLWKNKRIESPFEYLMHTFQRYTVQQLRHDLEKIPRFDILDRLRKMEMEGKLPIGCAGLFTHRTG